MKLYVKTIFSILLVSIWSFAIYAQEPELETPIQKSLNEEQQVLLNEHKELMKANKEQFKSSLSEEQKLILKNDQHTKEQKQTALKSSLSTEQMNMIKMQKQSMPQLRSQFKTTLSQDQKIEMRKNIKNKRENIKRVFKRTRLNNNIRN